ncbi:MAG: hypothetical protein V4635_09470 [Bacteroidota bacterium]
MTGETYVIEQNNIRNWTLEDCQGEEYWRKLFELGVDFFIAALDGEMFPSWKESRILGFVDGNAVVAEKMLSDLIQNRYLLGYIKEEKVINARPLWFIKNS